MILPKGGIVLLIILNLIKDSMNKHSQIVLLSKEDMLYINGGDTATTSETKSWWESSGKFVANWIESLCYIRYSTIVTH